MYAQDHADATASTGHVVGRTYLSREFGQLYTIERVTTLWECAPGGAVLVRWENGNRTTSTRPRALDPEVCTDCRRRLGASTHEWCSAPASDRAAVA
jgi:hypothetical protein